MEQTTTMQSDNNQKVFDSCKGHLSELDAFLFGLPGGFLLAGLLLFCFIMFGNAITGQNRRRTQPSASSNTRLDRDGMLGKKRKRGPPPSVELRPVDMNQMAMQEDAPDDIRAMALAGKLPRMKPSHKSTVKSSKFS